MKPRFIPFLIFICLAAAASYTSAANAPDIFNIHKKALDYNTKLPLDAEEQIIQVTDYFVKYHVTYNSVNGERIPAFLYVPRAEGLKKYYDSLNETDRESFDKKRSALGGPPWPAMFFMHFLQSDKSLADGFATQIVLSGYVLLAIDGVFKGEREQPGRNILEFDPKKTVANIRQQVIDTRRGVDYLASIPGLVDMNRLGYFGVSMGAITGTLATAVDQRFRVVVLADGAADLSVIYSHSELPDIQEAMDKIAALGYTPEKAFDILRAIDPLFYAPHIAPRPVLLINGKYDELFPREAMEAFHNAVREPKAVRWFDSGHILPVNHVILLTLKWFKKYL